METQSDFLVVRDLGFDLLQGHMFAKPMAPRKFERASLLAATLRWLELTAAPAKAAFRYFLAQGNNTTGKSAAEPRSFSWGGSVGGGLPCGSTSLR